jgi:HrpA-like RNA helicase
LCVVPLLQMAAFPIGPRHARMLLAAAAFEPTVPGALHHALALAAAISQESPFLSSSGDSEQPSREQADEAEAEQADAEVRTSSEADAGSCVVDPTIFWANPT